MLKRVSREARRAAIERRARVVALDVTAWIGAREFSLWDVLREAYADDIDPSRAPGRVRTLVEFTDAELAEIEAENARRRA